MMKQTQNKITAIALLNRGLTSALTKLVLVIATSAYATATLAEVPTSDNKADTYVDSIHQWGAWELDIEPAAGGLQQPSSQALNARENRVALRTNGFAAVSPATPAIPAARATATVPGTTPAIPPMPDVAPKRRNPVPGAIAPSGSTPTTVVTLPDF